MKWELTSGGCWVSGEYRIFLRTNGEWDVWRMSDRMYRKLKTGIDSISAAKNFCADHRQKQQQGTQA